MNAEQNLDAGFVTCLSASTELYDVRFAMPNFHAFRVNVAGESERGRVKGERGKGKRVKGERVT